jgi:hypothetical protein
MAIEHIGTGTRANDGTGESIKSAFDKVNTNFNYLDVDRIPTLISQEVANINSSFTGGTINNQTTFLDQTNSSSATSGAVVVTGGLGVGGDAHFAYQLTVPTINATTINSTNINVTSLAITGGIDDTSIGDTTPGPAKFTTLASTDLTTLDSLQVTNGTTFNGTVQSTGTYYGPAVSVTGDVAGTTATFAGSGQFNSIGVTNTVSAGNLTSTGSLTVSTATVNAGNLNITTGNINCGSGRFFGGATQVGSTQTARLYCGTEGGSPIAGQVNSAFIYTQDDVFVLKTAGAPASATDTGTEGELRLAQDGGVSYLYLCTATDTWVRTAFATW